MKLARKKRKSPVKPLAVSVTFKYRGPEAKRLNAAMSAAAANIVEETDTEDEGEPDIESVGTETEEEEEEPDIQDVDE